jgi:hypothetical protein
MPPVPACRPASIWSAIFRCSRPDRHRSPISRRFYGKHLAGAWRWVYVVTAVIALWFNVVVLIVRAFQKVASLKVLAPTGSESPFLIAQTAALVLFVVLEILAVISFRPRLLPS